MIQLSLKGRGRSLLTQMSDYANDMKELAAVEGEIVAACEKRRKACEKSLSAIAALDGAFDKVDKNQSVIDAREAALAARADAEAKIVEWKKTVKAAEKAYDDYMLGPAGREKLRRELAELEAARPIAPDDITIPDLPKPIGLREREKLAAKLNSAIALVADFVEAADAVSQLNEKRSALTARICEDESGIGAALESFRHAVKIEEDLSGLDNLCK